VPINKETKQSRGIAYVLFLVPQDAVKAITSLDGTIFQVRYTAHILFSILYKIFTGVIGSIVARSSRKREHSKRFKRK